MPTVKPCDRRIALLKDFYGEQLAGDFRSERFWELAKKESIPKHRFERIMQEESKVPCLFSFVDVHSSKGLNEDTIQSERNFNFLANWFPTFALNPPTEREAKEALCQIAVAHRLVNERDVTLAVEEWAIKEGNLQRLLAAKVLDSYRRSAQARRKDGNMAKLKKLLSMIFEEAGISNRTRRPKVTSQDEAAAKETTEEEEEVIEEEEEEEEFENDECLEEELCDAASDEAFRRAQAEKAIEILQQTHQRMKEEEMKDKKRLQETKEHFRQLARKIAEERVKQEQQDTDERSEEFQLRVQKEWQKLLEEKKAEEEKEAEQRRLKAQEEEEEARKAEEERLRIQKEAQRLLEEKKAEEEKEAERIRLKAQEEEEKAEQRLFEETKAKEEKLKEEKLLTLSDSLRKKEITATAQHLMSLLKVDGMKTEEYEKHQRMDYVKKIEEAKQNSDSKSAEEFQSLLDEHDKKITARTRAEAQLLQETAAMRKLIGDIAESVGGDDKAKNAFREQQIHSVAARALSHQLQVDEKERMAKVGEFKEDFGKDDEEEPEDGADLRTSGTFRDTKPLLKKVPELLRTDAESSEEEIKKLLEGQKALREEQRRLRKEEAETKGGRGRGRGKGRGRGRGRNKQQETPTNGQAPELAESADQSADEEAPAGMDPEMERQDAKLKRERDQEDEQKDSSPKKTIRRKITVVRKQKITGNEGTDKTDKKSKEEEAAKRQLEDKKEDAAKKRKIYREEKRAQSLSQLTSLATPSNQFRVVPEEDKLNGIMSWTVDVPEDLKELGHEDCSPIQVLLQGSFYVNHVDETTVNAVNTQFNKSFKINGSGGTSVGWQVHGGVSAAWDFSRRLAKWLKF